MKKETKGTDYKSWASKQIEHLRAGDRDQIDYDDVADELERLLSRLLQETEGGLCKLLEESLHVYCDSRGGCKTEVGTAQMRLLSLLRVRPGLRAALPELMERAWPKALEEGRIYARQFGDRQPPQENPWSLDQLLDPDFDPREAS